MTPSRLRELATRHGVRPDKALGQNFLTDPNTARTIAGAAGVGDGDHVLEIGAGLGSLTVALAATGASVTAIEFDRGLAAALREVAADVPGVEVVEADAMRMDWPALLGSHRWTMVSNLPYNIATPLLLDMLRGGLAIDRYLVMVQREVGERLAARPDDDGYGAVSVKVAYFATTEILRRVPATVFWPKPRVESVLVSLAPLAAPPVGVDRDALFRLVEEGFAQRRKTMANALRRLGLPSPVAAQAIAALGRPPGVRAESLSLEEFARLTEVVADAA